MQYLFTDLVAISDIQQLLTSFCNNTGIMAEIWDLDNHCILHTSDAKIFSNSQWINAWIEQRDWQKKEKVPPPASDRPMIRYEHASGLFKYVCPIRIGHQDIATLHLGPVAHTTVNESKLRQWAHASGSDEAAYTEIIRHAPLVTQRQTKDAIEFIIQLTQLLAEKGLNDLRLTETIAAIQGDQQKIKPVPEKREEPIQAGAKELDRINTALQESEQRFRVALMDTPVIVFNQDLNLRYTWVYNPHNYAEQPILGKTDADLFPPEDAMRLTALKRRVIAVGLLTREEVSINIGGRTLFYDMTLEPLFDANGNVTGLTCAATDITERKHSEVQIRRNLAESEGLHKITKGLLQKVGLDEVLEIVCVEAMQLTAAKGCVVLMLEEDGWLRLTHRAGLPVYTLDCLPVEGSLAGIAIQTGRYVWVNRQNSERDEAPDQWQGYPWTPGLLSMLSVPLKIETQTIGVLNILDKPGELTQEDVRIIDLFADQAAIIIEHVRLQNQAEQFAVLEERQRLARDLHDSVTQALYSLTLYADAAQMAFSSERWSSLERNLQEVRNMAREAMYDMRLLVFELRPLMLEKEGLASTLRARLAAVESRTGLITKLNVENEKRLPATIENELYRIAQEGLNNVVKHAKASEVLIQIIYTDSNIILELVDNGVGFDANLTNLSGGLGLQGIQERIQHLGGSLEVFSELDKGTRLTVKIPINS